ncbi:MAG: Ig-like domain-containing protein [Chloroflexota bacterium]|nr:Ig-like domain-containing protein [Chloroflexota bacterium]
MRKLYPIVVVVLLIVALFGTSTGQASPPVQDQQPPSVRLGAGTFVPGRGEAPPVPSRLTIAGYAAGQRGYYIVQFRGPVEKVWKDQVTALGAEILTYLPDFAFKVRMTPVQARQVESLDSVTWVGFFHPAYKLSPNLIHNGTGFYTVRVERGVKVGPVARSIVRSGAQVWRQEGHKLVIAADSALLETIAQVLDVAWVENYVLNEKHNEYGGGVIMGANTAHVNGYDGSTQIVAVADTGIGDGTPGGAHPDIPSGRIVDIHNLPGETDICFENIIDDGPQDPDSGHGTHTAVSVLGDGGPNGEARGIAPAARLVFQAVENWVEISLICQYFFGYEDGYYLPGLPSDLHDLFQQAYDDGARIHSNSWGAPVDGEYNANCVETDDFVWNNPDMTITTSAGNEGTDTSPANGVVDEDSIGSPATAKNIITIGASENDRDGSYPCDSSLTYTSHDAYQEGETCQSMGYNNFLGRYGQRYHEDFYTNPISDDITAGNPEQMAAWSSRGPTDDGRIKPDLVAPGTWILSGYSSLYQEGYGDPVNPQTGEYQWDGWGMPYSEVYKYMGGTSMANPLAAGAATVVRDYYQKAHSHSASAALVKATMINSAEDLLDENNDGDNDNDFPIPNNHEGWGRINLTNATDDSHQFVEEVTGLGTGGTRSYQYDVAGGNPFKVTLVWTDYPSTESASQNLVNDLDLVVRGPGGLPVYQGNVFSGGWSQTGGSADRINNVENIYVQSAVAGTWTVEVSGYNVPNGPQPFALVVDGVGEVDTPPIVSITSPNDGDDVTGVVNITADASDDVGVTQVEFFVDGSSIGVDTTAPYEVSWDSSAVGDGPHTISATATDTADQTGDDSIGVTVDNTPPTVSITSPTDGEIVAGTIAVTADANDATTEVTQVEFFVDGGSIGVDTDGSDGWSVSWDTTGASDGNHTLSATATDGVGLTGDSAGVGITVDNTPPTVSITSPTEGETVAGTIDVVADANDATTEVTQVEFFVDGNSIGTDTDGSDGWSVSWNTLSVGNGNHDLTATATDVADNIATSDPVTVNVQNEPDDPPTVSITNPGDGDDVTGLVNITADASDDVGVTQVEFFVNGNSIGVDDTAPYAVSWDSSTVGDGPHTISATATDTADQTGDDSIGVTVDNTPPTVSITSPTDGEIVAGTIAVTADANDATTEVTQVEFFVDGGSIGVDTDGSDGWSVSWDTTGASDGNHTLSATATDGVELTGDSAGVGVTVDNTPPTVSITNPTEGETVAGTIDVVADANDATTEVTQVEFFVDGGSIGVDTDGSDGWSVSWDTLSVGNGNHDLTATATDAADNIATSDPVTVTVDNGATMHVGDLDGSSNWIWGTVIWRATVTIEVHDANHNPVDGATVSGSWSGGASGSGECTTGSDGRCSVSTGYIWRGYSSTTFTVNNVADSLVYEPADNHDPDGDSDGTIITVYRP